MNKKRTAPIEKKRPDTARASTGNQKARRYTPQEIEKKWQKVWREEGLYRFKSDAKKKKYYNLVELPYPSGDLHLGHWFSFVTADIHARYKKMAGYNVFFPNGFDAFGLPAENAAIKRGIDPKQWTMQNIESMRKQFDTMGTMIDWSHEAITCLPEYYRWNQWIFLKMFEKGIAYRKKSLSNWCPKDQTVLANEHIESGRCWRCGTEVVQKEVEQWFLKITDYADRLLWDENPPVDWPKSVREGQSNWIGKSEGAKIELRITNYELRIEIYTTRIDTLFGMTFIVVAPEHPVVASLLSSKIKNQNAKIQEIEVYVERAKKKTELERKEEREKTGVFTGVYAEHPITKEKIPVWVADYVLAGYGTGAVMGVPAHDERDFAFALQYDLPVTQVIWSREGQALPFGGEGSLMHSGVYDGLDSKTAKEKILLDLEKKGIAKAETIYHLHDWSVSRQRYWGTPVPIIHCPKCGEVPVPEKNLPVVLPENVDFAPKGEPPLATAKEWLQVPCPKCGGAAERDAETLDTFFDSSWYYYRYVSPHYEEGPFDKLSVKQLLPVDIYYGGAEHTLGHTLYARFFTKFFKDIGLVDFDEFALKRVQHGVILGPDGNRMSKSKGNVVNPDDIAGQYGTDTVRTYLAFMMPYEATAPWSPDAIWGVHRFLKRVWELQGKIKNQKSNLKNEDRIIMNKTVKKVGEDIDVNKFNTAVSAIMIWLNHLSAKEYVTEEEYSNLLLLLAPFAPHMTEELWEKLQLTETKNEAVNREPTTVNDSVGSSIHLQQWPLYSDNDSVDEEIIIVVQVNGKVRETLQEQKSKIKDQKYLEEKARESERVQKFLEGKKILKVIYKEGKVLNFVIDA